MLKPSVGRIVHYVAYGTPGGEFPAGVCRAAVITETCKTLAVSESENASVCVLNPTGFFFNRDLPHDEDSKKPGTWHWPEIVN